MNISSKFKKLVRENDSLRGLRVTGGSSQLDTVKVPINSHSTSSGSNSTDDSLLTALAPEIVCHIAFFLDTYDDVFSLALCSRYFESVLDDPILYKSRLLAYWDHPPGEVPQGEWKKLDRTYSRLLSLLQSPPEAGQRLELLKKGNHVAKTVAAWFCQLAAVLTQAVQYHTHSNCSLIFSHYYAGFLLRTLVYDPPQMFDDLNLDPWIATRLCFAVALFILHTPEPVITPTTAEILNFEILHRKVETRLENPRMPTTGKLLDSSLYVPLNNKEHPLNSYRHAACNEHVAKMALSINKRYHSLWDGPSALDIPKVHQAPSFKSALALPWEPDTAQQTEFASFTNWAGYYHSEKGILDPPMRLSLSFTKKRSLLQFKGNGSDARGYFSLSGSLFLRTGIVQASKQYANESEFPWDGVRLTRGLGMAGRWGAVASEGWGGWWWIWPLPDTVSGEQSPME